MLIEILNESAETVLKEEMSLATFKDGVEDWIMEMYTATIKPRNTLEKAYIESLNNELITII